MEYILIVVFIGLVAITIVLIDGFDRDMEKEYWRGYQQALKDTGNYELNINECLALDDREMTLEEQIEETMVRR